MLGFEGDYGYSKLPKSISIELSFWEFL
ncbi:MAG: hypothetical protein RL682_2366, partial [Pseudomonadota bacterium]